ncbi:hypothetical protein K431DRAFT_122931 [Polychaeton citri CBS 116435]|uniref:Uncharacterized protein n=1 Tax=Polychaeton citri CBS 116435 TaxID=1314669 RepID=A0A9P4UMM1_9PEZI|nr:hypothetical protein K431DRAFT_122931 [Polychaeton citri CBS 116435]
MLYKLQDLSKLNQENYNFLTSYSVLSDSAQKNNHPILVFEVSKRIRRTTSTHVVQSQLYALIGGNLLYHSLVA